jgi:hypothetical protein
VLAVVATAGYWAILVRQASGIGWVAYVVSALILVPALGCAIGTSPLVSGSVRAILLSWSAFTLLALAVIAGFSIGIFLLPSALLAVAAAVIATRSVRSLWAVASATIGAIAGVATIIGFLSSEPYLPPDCPTQRGFASGTTEYGPGLFSPGVRITWECRDGRLLRWQTATPGPESPTVSSGSAGP